VDDAAQIAADFYESQHAVAVGDVLLDEGKPSEFTEYGKPRFLQPYIIIFVEVVDAQDLLATLQQPAGDVEADKPGSAGQQDRHDFLFLRLSE